MMLPHLHAGWLMFRRNIEVRVKGFPQYKGSANAICKQIIKDCYDAEKMYFRTSNGHFRQFWARDFGLCTQALMDLGFEEEVHRTLQFALRHYSRHGRVTTQISPEGVACDSFSQSTDSLPFLLRSLRIAKAEDLVEVYRHFLDDEVLRYKNAVFDRRTGLVKQDAYFASMKDGFRRESSCYDNSCVASLSKELDNLGLKNPFQKYDFGRLLLQNFWSGTYFYDDLRHEDYVAGDANTMPYYFGIVKIKSYWRKSHSAIRRDGLDKPLPLKYTASYDTSRVKCVQRLLTPNYEGNTVWLHLGLAFLEVVSRNDKKLLRKYLGLYKSMILKYKNFPEVLNPDLTPYKSPLYYCDDSMSWASIYLWLTSQV